MNKTVVVRSFFTSDSNVTKTAFFQKISKIRRNHRTNMTIPRIEASTKNHSFPGFFLSLLITNIMFGKTREIWKRHKKRTTDLQNSINFIENVPVLLSWNVLHSVRGDYFFNGFSLEG